MLIYHSAKIPVQVYSCSSAAWVHPSTCPNSVFESFYVEAEHASHQTSIPASVASILS